MVLVLLSALVDRGSVSHICRICMCYVHEVHIARVHIARVHIARVHIASVCSAHTCTCRICASRAGAGEVPGPAKGSLSAQPALSKQVEKKINKNQA